MSDDERARELGQKELSDAELVELIASDGAASADHPIWKDERFLEWLRKNALPATSSELAEEGRRMMARAVARGQRKASRADEGDDR